MQWSDISFTPSARTLRQFAGLCFFFFGLLAGLEIHRDRPSLAAVFAVLGVVVGFSGLLKPALIRPVYVGAIVVTFPIGWTVSKLVLACLFYGVFTPVGLLFRLLGRDALGRGYRPALESYWALKSMPTDPHRYFRPF
jgi:hypothetical protein